MEQFVIEDDNAVRRMTRELKIKSRSSEARAGQKLFRSRGEPWKPDRSGAYGRAHAWHERRELVERLAELGRT